MGKLIATSRQKVFLSRLGLLGILQFSGEIALEVIISTAAATGAFRSHGTIAGFAMK